MMSDTALITGLVGFGGVVIGGIFTWWVGRHYFRKQDERAEQTFDVLARFLENFAANPSGTARIEFTKDAEGRRTGVRIAVDVGIGEARWEGFAPTVTVTSIQPLATRNNTESAKGGTL